MGPVIKVSFSDKPAYCEAALQYRLTFPNFPGIAPENKEHTITGLFNVLKLFSIRVSRKSSVLRLHQLSPDSSSSIGGLFPIGAPGSHLTQR